MDNTEKIPTQTDIELMKNLISASILYFSREMNIDPKTLSAYNKSDIANLSRMTYQYIVKDCKTDEDKKRCFSDEAYIRYGTLISRAYRKLVDFRYRSASKGLRVYSELSFTLESSLTYLITEIQPLSHLNPTQSLLPDMFLKFFNQALGLMKMLNLDLSSEAYSNWRTLHEAECVIKLLVEGGNDLQQVYLTHLVYNNAFRHAIQDKDETDRIFVELKGKMVQHGLKSKDMKKFIEYGWLYSCKTYHEADPNYKLNFRNGLQKAAGLGDYNEWYEMASEMAHSSPIFFYSNNSFFQDLTSVNLSDITLRSIRYLITWMNDNNIKPTDDATYRDILFNNLQNQVKKEDDSFYTKYKDYLADDDEADNSDDKED